MDNRDKMMAFSVLISQYIYQNKERMPAHWIENLNMKCNAAMRKEGIIPLYGPEVIYVVLRDAYPDFVVLREFEKCKTIPSVPLVSMVDRVAAYKYLHYYVCDFSKVKEYDMTFFELLTFLECEFAKSIVQTSKEYNFAE